MLWHLVRPAPIDQWYRRDLDVLEHCHILVRFPGKSTGADDECSIAHELGIPIVYLDDDESRMTLWRLIKEWAP